MAAVLFNASAAMAAASPEPELLANLRSLSIDDLANVEIYSVSKSAEPLSQAPAAIYVITREDIRRSGATSIPEMLRLAPNLQVARASALSYAISARGFNDITANKLLVLIDGRSVYTPLYSGVFWDSQSVLPEDVERIEVISGPGATLWGSNAVNGVINIITRNSRDTQGGVVSITGGNAESGVGARFGGQLGENATFRIYGMGFYRNSTILANGRNRNDSWTNPQGGFRVDWNKSSDTLTVQGDIFSGAIEQPTTAHATIEGRNLLGRWTHDFSGGSTMRIQTYYDYSSRSIPGGAADSVEVFDLDLQHSFLLGERNSIVWGGGYRVTSDRFRNAPTGAFLDPTSKTLELGNLFVEDSISVTENLTLIAGVKAEANSYTDIAAMPSARLSWKVAETDMVWAAISRAVRTPARFDKDVYQKNGPLLVVGGGPHFQDETLTAYELGYRTQTIARTSLSISAYYNVYDDLRSLELSPTGSIPITFAGRDGFLPATFGNMMEGNVYGAELWGIYNLADWWRLTAGFNAMHRDLRFKAGSLDVQGLQMAGNDPSYQASLRSSMNLAHNMDLDIGLRGVSALSNPKVPGYVELDARLGWHISPSFELSIAGFNLINAHHTEFVALPTPSELGRSFTVNTRWTF